MARYGEAPEAWKVDKCCYGSGLTLELAKKMLEAGEKEALKQGVPMSMAISDSGGNPNLVRPLACSSFEQWI